MYSPHTVHLLTSQLTLSNVYKADWRSAITWQSAENEYSVNRTLYFSNLDICWLITSFGSDYVIKLTVVDFAIEWDFDFVEIYGGE